MDWPLYRQGIGSRLGGEGEGTITSYLPFNPWPIMFYKREGGMGGHGQVKSAIASKPFVLSYKIVRERERAHLCNITLQKCNNRTKPKPNFPARKLANFFKLFVKTAKVLKEMQSDLFLYIKECHCRNLSRKSELCLSWTLIIVLYTVWLWRIPCQLSFVLFPEQKEDC